MSAQGHPPYDPQNGIGSERDAKQLVEAGQRTGPDDEPVHQRPTQADENQCAHNIETELAHITVEPPAKNGPGDKARDTQNGESKNAPLERRAKVGDLRWSTVGAHAFGNAIRIELKPAH